DGEALLGDLTLAQGVAAMERWLHEGAVRPRLVLQRHRPRWAFDDHARRELPSLPHEGLAPAAPSPRLLHEVIEHGEEPGPQGEIALVHGAGQPCAEGQAAPLAPLQEPSFAVAPAPEHVAALREPRSSLGAEGLQALRRLSEPAQARWIDALGG